MIPFEIMWTAADRYGFRVVSDPVGDPFNLIGQRCRVSVIEEITRQNEKVVRRRIMAKPVKPASVEMKVGKMKNGHGMNLDRDRTDMRRCGATKVGLIGKERSHDARRRGRWIGFAHTSVSGCAAERFFRVTRWLRLRLVCAN